MEETESSIVEVKEVVVAAQRLQELGARMQSDTFGFKRRDVAHIDSVIDALHELELHRNKAMDILETETIKCAAVRHKLMHYPDEINREIEEAVKAARDLNEDEINDLKRQLQEILDEISYLETHAGQLDAETESLTPDRDQMKAKFEEAVARLNERLADKAGEQITLNENRDSVRVANVGIVDLEEDVVRLREKMVVERGEYREEKQRLVTETAATVDQFNEQKARNDEKRQEYTSASVQLIESTKELDELTKLNKNLEKENAQLEAREKDTRMRIQQQKERNVKLREEMDRIRTLNRKLIDEHQKKMADMKKTVGEFNEKCKKQTRRRDKAIEKKDEIRDGLEEALLVRERDAKRVREMNEVLQEAKNDLATKAEDIGRLQQEIIDMENRRIELEDAHRSAVLTFNKQIAELKEQLTRERGERMTVQDTNDELQSTIDKFNKEMNAYTRKMNKRITDLKHENVALNDEHAELTKKIKDDTERRLRLLQEIDKETGSFTEMRQKKEGMVEFLTEDLQRLLTERDRRASELAELQPKFDEFVAFFDKTTAEYEALKKTIVALKNRKQGLEETSKRTDAQIGRLKTEIEELERDKRRRREQTETQLKQQADDRTKAERQIYVIGCKLKTVLEENARLRAGIAKFAADTREMRDTWEKSLRAKYRADERRRRQREKLEDGWRDDANARAEFHEEDKRLLAALAAILEDTGAREALLGQVTEQLFEELGRMDGFLRTSEPDSRQQAEVELKPAEATVELKKKKEEEEENVKEEKDQRPKDKEEDKEIEEVNATAE